MLNCISLLALLLSLPAAAQYRAVPEDAPAALSAAVDAVPVEFSALPDLSGLSLPENAVRVGVPHVAPIAVAPSAVSAAVPASAVLALPAEAPEVSARAVSPSAAPRAPPRPALAAASALIPGRGGSRGSAREKSLDVFDGGRPLNVLTAGAEAVPFIKTGGLADVVDALSRGLSARGHRVMMVLPKYRALKLGDARFHPAGEVSVPIGDRVEKAKLLAANVNGVDVVLLDHPGYYGRPGGPYQGAPSSYSNDDNNERFAFYARASLEAAKALGFRPDVVHAHDWHAALIPAYLKTAYAADPFFAKTKTALTIHNLAFQGVFDLDFARSLGFPEHYFAATAPLEYWGRTSYLKAGLALADAVTTVSPTYAREILSEKLGMGLDGVLRARHDGVRGILNGIDMEMWDPATDGVLPRPYPAESAASGKAFNKAWMQRRLGLDPQPNAPLFAVASRLSEQKGIDVIVAAVDEMVARGAQVVVMGSGDKDLEEAVLAAAARHPGRVAAYPFDETFVRVAYAAADFLLMPSRFEPCGLSQLIAQRYGTLPLVTRTGGLVDTVTDLRGNPANGDGLAMSEPSVPGLMEAVDAAIALYRNPEALAAARQTAMAKDSSWEKALDAYEALYRKLIARR